MEGRARGRTQLLTPVHTLGSLARGRGLEQQPVHRLNNAVGDQILIIDQSRARAVCAGHGDRIAVAAERQHAVGHGLAQAATQRDGILIVVVADAARVREKHSEHDRTVRERRVAEVPTEPAGHVGVEVESTDEVAAVIARTQELGFEQDVQENVSCCFAVQDKTWVRGPENDWEFYTVLADAPAASCATDSGCCPAEV